MRVVLFILMFFLLGAFFIVSNENIHLNNSKEFSKFYSLYFKWNLGIIDNLQGMTGYMVKFDWLPQTNLTKK